MRVTILGSGTLVPRADRRPAAHLVEGADFRLLLDCGAGAVHTMGGAGTRWRELSHLALTHFHTDHTSDLPALMWALKHAASRRSRPLTIIGPEGLWEFLEDLARAFGAFVTSPGFPVEAVELEPVGEVALTEDGARLRCHPTPHTERSLAFRVEQDGASVAYTGDTGPDLRLYAFLAGADLVITECAESDPPGIDTHLSPAGVAALGRRAAPGRIVVTHVYPPLKAEEVPGLVLDAGWDGEVIAGHDGLTLDV